MTSRMKIYLDGAWVSKEQAKLSVFDHGVLYGDGVFEGIRAYHGRAFRLKEHLQRLKRSADQISLKMPLSINELDRLVNLALRKNNLRDAYIRLLLTRGVGDLGLDPRKCAKPSVVIIADNLALFPAECYEKGLSVIIAKTVRNLPQAINPTIKSMNYLNNILAKIEANRAGVPEALMLNSDGYVAECTGDNVFLINGQNIVTPPVSAGALEGITRAAVMKMVKAAGEYSISEKLFKPAALFQADEIFFTGTAAEIIPVTRIDKRRIGTGRAGVVTRKLIEDFKSVVRREAGVAG
jgi:branched-chain amino acid aminotransferase